MILIVFQGFDFLSAQCSSPLCWSLQRSSSPWRSRSGLLFQIQSTKTSYCAVVQQDISSHYFPFDKETKESMAEFLPLARCLFGYPVKLHRTLHFDFLSLFFQSLWANSGRKYLNLVVQQISGHCNKCFRKSHIDLVRCNHVVLITL